jgi:hypothetical protein
LLGSDAYNAAEQHALQILRFDKEWKDLSISTDSALQGLGPTSPGVSRR